MKRRLVMFQSLNAGRHAVGVLPEAVAAVEHVVQDAASALAGIAAGTVIHLVSGVALHVVGGVSDVIDALDAKSKDTALAGDTAAAADTGASSKTK